MKTKRSAEMVPSYASSLSLAVSGLPAWCCRGCPGRSRAASAATCRPAATAGTCGRRAAAAAARRRAAAAPFWSPAGWAWAWRTPPAARPPPAWRAWPPVEPACWRSPGRCCGWRRRCPPTARGAGSHRRARSPRRRTPCERAPAMRPLACTAATLAPMSGMISCCC